MRRDGVRTDAAGESGGEVCGAVDDRGIDHDGGDVAEERGELEIVPQRRRQVRRQRPGTLVVWLMGSSRAVNSVWLS
jgi:hypothetical protein